MQTTAPDGKRAIADAQYDSRGLQVKSSSFYNNASGPAGVLVAFADTDVPMQRRATYDGMGRLTADALWSFNALKSQTTTSYDGDRVNVDPPAGGVASTTITDAHGRTVALRQYHSGSPTGAYDETTYEYDRLDRLTSVTDPAGNVWSFSYDLRGRLVSKVDPGAGTSQSTYDDADQLVTTTDARGKVLYRSYDDLGRLKELRDDGPAGALRVSYVYDTLAKGQVTSSTRHVGPDAYTTMVTGYTDLYQPEGTTVIVPVSQGPLAGSYTTTASYHVDGSLASINYPSKGGLPAETVTYTYTDTGFLSNVVGIDTYLADAQYYWHGAIKQQLLGSGANRVRLTRSLDDATGWLTKFEVHTERPGTPGAWDEALTEQYTHDPVGNITGINETSGGATVSHQCFSYDYVRRLIEAWTTTAAVCQSTPSQAVVGGPDPYWQSFTYDSVGNRLTETVHSAGGDITRTYSYPPAGGPQPHALSRVTTSGGGPTSTYTYDAAGNIATRTMTGQPDQTFTFDAEGHLSQVTVGSVDHTYLYDAEGARLISDDPGIAKTLYLGDAEYRLDYNTNQVTGTRYYPNAVRTPSGLSWLTTDHHGTGQLAVDAATLDITRRRFMPFGEARGASPATWPDQRGFVGGTSDPTGYVHLGAREYDPSTGRFLSVDPIQDLTDPQQWNSYAYANNSPVTFTDPDGLRPLITDTVQGDEAHHRKTGEKVVQDTNGKWVVKKTKPKKPGDGSKSGNGSGKGSSGGGPSQADIDRAKKIKEQSAADIIIQAGGQLLLSLFGIDNILSCIDGDAMSCVHALADMLPIGKALSLLSKAPKIAGILARAGKALAKWSRDKKWADEVLAAAKSCAIKHSFAPGTKVVMADGSHRPIEELKPGDRVLVADPETGTTGVREVTHTHVNDDTDLTDITIKTDDGKVVVLNTTQHHPFWSQTRHEWVFAADLQPGEQLRSADGTSATVTAVHSYSGAEVMHALTVADIHTYYVVAGTTPVLVHNCGGGEVPHFKAYPQEFLDQAAKYGKGGVRELPDGRVRFYGEIAEARTPGEMVGRRLVREWNPDTGATRIWHETLDHSGNVRIVRPDVGATGGNKVHYMFDAGGNYTGSW